MHRLSPEDEEQLVQEFTDLFKRRDRVNYYSNKIEMKDGTGVESQNN